MTAKAVLAMLDTGEWKLVRHPHDDSLTDEFNAANAWSVTRTTAPYEDAQRRRLWFGRTAWEALSTAATSLGLKAPEAEKPVKVTVTHQGAVLLQSPRVVRVVARGERVVCFNVSLRSKYAEVFTFGYDEVLKRGKVRTTRPFVMLAARAGSARSPSPRQT